MPMLAVALLSNAHGDISALFQLVVEGVYVLRGLVNVYLLRTSGGLVLIDTGFPGSEGKIIEALRSLGHGPRDVSHIILTHGHPDHIGSAAALKRETGATVWANNVDKPIIEAGRGFRPLKASPGLRNKLVAWLILGRVKEVEPTKVDGSLADRDHPAFAPELTAISVPGHCAGQLAFLWAPSGGLLITADACINRRGLQLPAGTEDIAEVRRSLVKPASLTFNVAAFGHGPPINAGADAVFRWTWIR